MTHALWATLAATAACGGLAVAAQPQFSPMPRVKSIVEQIGALEGDRDPKCDATASRLEDFMFGTPLTHEARFLKNDRQKALIVSIWSRASAKAKAAGEKVISKGAVDAAIGELVRIERTENAWRVGIGGDDQVIDATDKRQYSTVAYSLRAILAVEQDQLLGHTPEMLPLDDSAIASLKEAVDLYTLAMLQRADRQARLGKKRGISRETLAAAWRAPGKATPAPTGAAKADVRPGQGYPVLKEIIEQKVRSFEKYNSVSSQVFLRNLQVYFARHRWPVDPQLADRFKALYTEAMIGYAQELVRGSERSAREKRSATITAVHVYDYGQKITPHRINEYEDATFFPKLPRNERVEIEAYDMDAFRDGGLHWRYLQEAIKDDVGRLEPDPFAAEIITENIAQFGVLLLKEAGRLSKAAGHETLHPDYVEVALKDIQRKIDLNAANSATAPPAEALRSAASASRGAPFVEVTASSGIDYRHRNQLGLAWQAVADLHQEGRAHREPDGSAGLPGFGSSGGGPRRRRQARHHLHGRRRHQPVHQRRWRQVPRRNPRLGPGLAAPGRPRGRGQAGDRHGFR
jgi:enediyne biosynthesis protein E4